MATTNKSAATIASGQTTTSSRWEDLVHMAWIMVLGVGSLVLVAEFARYKDANITGTYDYWMSVGSTDLFRFEGLTVPLEVWLQLAIFELLCLGSAFFAFRRHPIWGISLVSICGVGYVLAAVIPLWFSSIPAWILG